MSIALDNLTKQLGGPTVVDNFSLEVAAGKLFVLLGASGSGKSTVLRLIAGLLSPDVGRVLLEDRDVTALPPQARRVGFMFQNYSIFRHMTVAQNVEFGLKIRNVPAEERVGRREELLHMVDLAGLGGRYAAQLSGGQQQRVALARALAYRPQVLLLDEPFSALDVKIRAQLRRTVKELQRRLDLTTIMVTHDQDEAFELADHVGVMERGRLLEVGSAESLYYRPRTFFVATFVGAGAVLAGRVEDGQAHLGPVHLPLRAAAEEGARMQVLVRPEEVALSAGHPAPEAVTLGRGTVEEQTFGGATRRVRVRLPLLPGTRQLAPPLPFGEEQMVLEALLPGKHEALPAEVWVSLQGWRVLEAPRPQILVYDPGEATRGMETAATRGAGLALHLAQQLGEALEGTVTELKIDPHEDVMQAILREEARTWYELSVVGRGQRGLDDLLAGLLDRPRHTPLLAVRGLAGGPPHELRTIMICTAAGEAGKQDVRVGGRLARRLGARVILLHVITGTPRALAAQHLQRALGTLRSLSVTATSEIVATGQPVNAILDSALASDVDLLVIGQHAPEARLRLVEPNVMRDLVALSRRPVLIVPE